MMEIATALVIIWMVGVLILWLPLSNMIAKDLGAYGVEPYLLVAMMGAGLAFFWPIIIGMFCAQEISYRRAERKEYP